MTPSGQARQPKPDLPEGPPPPRKLPSWLQRLSATLGVDTAPDPVRFGSSMLRNFGWLYWVLGLGPALGRVRFEDHSSERVRQAASRGPIVYVLLRRSTLDHLALNTVLNRRRLPLSIWAHGTTSFPWQPVISAWLGLLTRVYERLATGKRPAPLQSGWLTETVASGYPVTIFMQHQGGPFRLGGGDPFQAIVDAQAKCDREIQLLPVIAVWDRAPERDMPVRNFILGSRENPGLFTTGFNLYSPVGREPFVQVGEALNLSELCRRVPSERRVETLRVMLRRYLRREGRVVRGPTLLPQRVLEELVLDNPPMRSFAEEEAQRTGRSLTTVRTAMTKEFRAIAANFSWTVIWALSYLCRPLWNRVYSGYDIRDEDLDRIRTAVRDGTAVLVPSHKSHFDYLLMSWVLYHHDLVPPHVVAGNNLAIWPVSILLRGAGGFFIRRSFDQDQLHPTVFERYLRELIRQEYTVEFFIEGGRTRSGQLLRPRLGVLEMVLDAAAKSDGKREVTLLPVSIVYEQIAEAAAYRSELGGARKRKENLLEVLRAGGVLRRRFGRVYVRVGEPMKASGVIGPREQWLDLEEPIKRSRLRDTGERLIRGIGDVVVLLPTTLVALAVLAHPRRAVEHHTLKARITRFRELIARFSLPEAASLERFDQAITQALTRCVERGLLHDHTRGQVPVWEAPPDQRLALDFHKNEVMHVLAPAAIAAAAIRSLSTRAFTQADLSETFSVLEQTLYREFTYDPDLTAEERCARALGDLEAHGALSRVDSTWTIAQPDHLEEVHALLRGLFEAYLLVLRSSRRYSQESTDRASLIKEIQSARDTWLTAGVATRPEAFSAVSLKNAVAAFIQEGLFTQDGQAIRADLAAVKQRDAVLVAALGI